MEQLTEVALGLSCLGAGWDFFTRRIPNWLTLSGILIGLILQAWLGGLHGLGQGALGVLVAFVLYYPLFFFGIMGGGDVKLLMLVGAFSNAIFGFEVGIAAIMVGGIYAAIDTLLRGRLFQILNLIYAFIFRYLSRDEVVGMLDKQRKFSFGFAIALGIVVVVFAQNWGLFS